MIATSGSEQVPRMKFLVSEAATTPNVKAKLWIFQIILLVSILIVVNAAPAPKPQFIAGVPSFYSPYYETPYSYSNFYSYPSVYSPYIGSGLGKIPTWE